VLGVRADPVSREEDIQRMRARHSMGTRREDTRFPVTGPWSFHGLCEHEHGWKEAGEHWLQCKICWWCKPKLGKPPKLEMLPAILKNRVLPPLTGKVDLSKVFRNAGFVLDDDRSSVLSMVRVHVVQHQFIEDPLIRRCGAEVRFKDHGWQRAAVFYETALYKLIEIVAKAVPRKPRALWSAIQAAFSRGWTKPWERA
jgi:hypothetical protein